jgi:hypothetical protein
MTKVKIVNMRDKPRLLGPGRREVDIEVLYETESGYSGSITLPKKGLTEEALQQAIHEDIALQEEVLGKELEV